MILVQAILRWVICKNYPIHELKIDQSFIAHLADNPDDDAVVDSIIQLAVNKKLNIVAEGVETKEQAQCLIGKCSDILLQGYYYSNPIPATGIGRNFFKESLGCEIILVVKEPLTNRQFFLLAKMHDNFP